MKNDLKDENASFCIEHVPKNVIFLTRDHCELHELPPIDATY